MNKFEDEFLNKLGKVCASRRISETFTDFLTLTANSFANVLYKSEELENEYLNIIRKYKNPDIFPELLAMIVQEFEQNRYQDLLGKIYMQADFGNARSGQFFTPFHISDFMAQITLCKDDVKKKSKKKDTLRFASLVPVPAV